MLYQPFRKETDLATDNSYVKTLLDEAVLQVVNQNKLTFEPYSEFIDEALSNFEDVLRPDPILDFENDETAIAMSV